jgi:hypothetical protein
MRDAMHNATIRAQASIDFTGRADQFCVGRHDPVTEQAYKQNGRVFRLRRRASPRPNRSRSSLAESGERRNFSRQNSLSCGKKE